MNWEKLNPLTITLLEAENSALRKICDPMEYIGRTITIRELESKVEKLERYIEELHSRHLTVGDLRPKAHRVTDTAISPIQISKDKGVGVVNPLEGLKGTFENNSQKA